MWGAGRRVQGAGWRVQGAWCGVQGAGCRVQGAGCRVQGSEVKVQGPGFRVQRFRVQGSGFRVQSSSVIPGSALTNVFVCQLAKRAKRLSKSVTRWQKSFFASLPQKPVGLHHAHEGRQPRMDRVHCFHRDDNRTGRFWKLDEKYWNFQQTSRNAQFSNIEQNALPHFEPSLDAWTP